MFMICDMTKPTNWLCAQSDQSLHCALNGYLRTQAVFMWTAKTLIRLGGFPGWSESSLGAQSLCWFCHAAVLICLPSMLIENYLASEVARKRHKFLKTKGSVWYQGLHCLPFCLHPLDTALYGKALGWLQQILQGFQIFRFFNANIKISTESLLQKEM